MESLDVIQLFELSRVDHEIWQKWPRQINETWSHLLIVPRVDFDAMLFFVAPYVVDTWDRDDVAYVLLNRGRKLFAVANGILCGCYAGVSSRDAAREALKDWADHTLSPFTTVCEKDSPDPANPRIYQTVSLAAGIVRPLTVQTNPIGHERRCHDCGAIAWHRDNVERDVQCRRCGSMDTRRIQSAEGA